MNRVRLSVNPSEYTHWDEQHFYNRSGSVYPMSRRSHGIVSRGKLALGFSALVLRAQEATLTCVYYVLWFALFSGASCNPTKGRGSSQGTPFHSVHGEAAQRTSG